MILSEAVLNKIEFYEAERFDKACVSSVVLHWKRQWWEIWKEPTTIRINSRVVSDDNNPGVNLWYADDEWEELADQLRDYFLTLAPKQKSSAKIIMIKGGKDE